jgi:hypothetical protein
MSVQGINGQLTCIEFISKLQLFLAYNFIGHKFNRIEMIISSDIMLNGKPTPEFDSLLSAVRRVRHSRPAYLGVTFEEQFDKIISSA